MITFLRFAEQVVITFLIFAELRVITFLRFAEIDTNTFLRKNLHFSGIMRILIISLKQKVNQFDMSFFDDKFIQVAIVIYDGDGNVINRAKPNVENMRTAHKVGRKMRDKTNHGEDYEVIQV